jgi:LPS sulfotransferase NodH
MSLTSPRFVIYAQGRTGSHLLMSLLASHSQIECAGELLNRQDFPGWRQYVRRGALRAPDLYVPRRARRATRPCWGGKVPIATSARGLARLQARGWHILFLERTSVFDRAVSWCVATLAGRFQSTGQEHAPRLHVPEQLFLEQLAFRAYWDRESRRVMQGIPHLRLTYEADLAHPAMWQQTASRVCTALGLANEPLTGHTARSWDRRYEDIVENFDRLQELFESSVARPV